MTSESDLRASIEELANEADPSVVVNRLQHVSPGRSPRPRMLLPIAAAAAVVAIAIGVAAVGLRHGGGTKTGDIAKATPTLPCATTTTPSFTTFTVGPVSDLDTTITSATTCAGYQKRSFYTTSGGLLGSITVYQPHVFHEAAVQGAKRVTGSGLKGYYVSELPDPASGGPCRAKTAVAPCLPGLAWQYAAGAWATITSDALPNPGGLAKIFFGADPVAKLLSVAAAVRTDAKQSLISSFRLGDLAGLLPLSAATATTSLHHNEVGQAASQLDVAVPGQGHGCPGGAACTGAVSINVDSTVDPPGSSLGAFTGRHVRIGSSNGLLISGKQRVPIGRQLRFQSGHWFVIIIVLDDHAGITDDQLLKIARNMTFAPSTTDSATWFRFNEALPR